MSTVGLTRTKTKTGPPPPSHREQASSAAQPSLLYVSTLDHIIRVMLPHLDAARAAGFRVEVACQVTRFREEVEAHADAVHHIPFQRNPLHHKNLVGLWQLTALIRRNRYSIAHCHNPTGGFMGRLAATLGKAGLRVYTAHGFHFHRHGSRLGNFVYRSIEMFAGHLLSDAVLVINHEDYHAALRDKVVPSHRLFLTRGVGVSAEDDFNPECVSDEERRAVRAEVGAEDDNIPVLTIVGEMIPRKRHADALGAMARIVKKHPQAILILAGDGTLTERLKARARALGVEESCRFLGFRRDIRQILAATDIYLFPSRQEGLPCAVQEALSMGVPVVASDVRGNSDLIDPSCGRLTPLHDTEALADAVSGLLALSREERRAMGEAGREKMLRLYNRPDCVAGWMDVYRRLWGPGKAPAALVSAAGQGEAQ